MSAKTREIDAVVARVLTDAGAALVGRSHDGAGHRVVAFRYNGHERSFHYANTGKLHGHGIRNMKQRLKWLLDEIPPAPPEPVPIPQVKAAPAPRPAAPTPPTRRRLTKARRSEIVKRYASADSIEQIMAEFDLTHKTAETLLMATAGSIRTKYERERHAKRCELARKRRKPEPVPEPIDAFRSPTPADKRRIYVLCKFGLPRKDAAELFHISLSYVHLIIREEKKRDVG